MFRSRDVASTLFLVGVAGAGAGAGACGSNHNGNLPDAPFGGSDGGTVDAPNADAGATSVTVSALAHEQQGLPNGTPQAGLPIAVVQPDGTLGPTASTDANGSATLDGVEAGATVHVLYQFTVPDTSTTSIVDTVVGVKPGDHLTFGDRYRDPFPSITPVAFALTFNTVGGATNYQAFYCNGEEQTLDQDTGATATLTGSADCGPTTTVFVVALDDSDGPLATVEVANAPIAGGSAIAVPDLIPVPAQSFTGTVTDSDDTVSQIEFTASTIIDRVAKINDNFNFSSPGTPVPISIPLGGDRVFTAGEVTSSTANLGREQMIAGVDKNATTVTLPASALPFVGSSPTIDLVGQTISWTETGSDTADGDVVSATWQRPDGSNTDTFVWNVTTPPGTTSLSWAGAPAAVASELPTSTDSVNPTASTGFVLLVDLASAVGYDAFRAAPEWQRTCPQCSAASGELTGQLNVSFDGGEGAFPPSF